MTKDWSSTIATVDRTIREYGRPIEIQITEVGPADPAKPWEGPTNTVSTINTVGVFVDPNNSEDNYDFAEKIHTRSEVRRSDYHIYVPATDLTKKPKSGDKVSDGEETFQVVTVSPVKPGTQAICYILQVQI